MLRVDQLARFIIKKVICKAHWVTPLPIFAGVPIGARGDGNKMESDATT